MRFVRRPDFTPSAPTQDRLQRQHSAAPSFGEEYYDCNV